MRLVIVSPSYPTSKTIDFIFVDQLCRAFANKGCEVTIIAPQSLTKSILRGVPIVKKKSYISLANDKKLTLIRPIYLSFGKNKIFKSFTQNAFNKSIQKALNQLQVIPDICYGHFWGAVYPIYSFAKKHDIPLFASSGEEIITLHIDYSEDELRDFKKYIKGVISVSTKNKYEVVKAGLASEDKCEVIVNAVDTTLFYKKNKSGARRLLGFSDKDFIVVFVGQFSERKGVNRLSSALNLLNDKSIKVLFIGTGLENPDYGNTIFKGSVSHDSLPDYLNCADIFVLPTSNEGCSNAIIEALACGLPIVSSDLSFNYDILNRGNSILVDPYDINAIANSIKLLKDNATIRNELSLGALKTSLELTLEARASKILEYINNNVK